jgi:hypothetical protein
MLQLVAVTNRRSSFTQLAFLAPKLIPEQTIELRSVRVPTLTLRTVGFQLQRLQPNRIGTAQFLLTTVPVFDLGHLEECSAG